MSTVRRKSGTQRGFALLVILLIIAVAAGTVGIALRDATTGLAEVGGAKSTEIVYSDLTRGLSVAMEKISQTDPVALIDTTNRWDIFANPPSPAFITPATDTRLGAPSGAPYGVEIEIGLRPGQRTNPPPGEDVRTTYGYVVEVQLQASINSGPPASWLSTNAGVVPAVERVSVGVRIPEVLSHSNN